MKRIRFTHEVVSSIPEVLVANTLYVTTEGDVAGHLCACGCGKEVITPLSPTDWSLEFTRRGASLSPSIGNWAFPCRSHYFLWDGAVVWARDMSDKAVAAGRMRDKASKQRYYEQLAHEPKAPSQSKTATSPPAPSSNWASLGRGVLTWWRRLFPG